VAKTAVASADGDDFEYSSRLLHDAAMSAADALREFARLARGETGGEPEVVVNLYVDSDAVTSSIVASIKYRRLQ
jgi:hypothetical protein